jgi:hypothetical protein
MIRLMSSTDKTLNAKETEFLIEPRKLLSLFQIFACITLVRYLKHENTLLI